MKTAIFNFRLLFFLFINIAFVIPALSQPGSIDPAFNFTDQGAGGANGTIFSTAIQSDGKIVIFGGFTMYNGTARKGSARLNTDGSLDAGFNPGTGANNTIKTTAIQSDGTNIIGGIGRTYNGTGRNRMGGLNTGER